LIVNFEARTGKIRQSGISGWILRNIVQTNWNEHTHTPQPQKRQLL